MLTLSRGVVKYYQRQAGEPDTFVLELLDDHTFNSSEVVAFMGRNGSGKSTLLNCIAGLNEKQYYRGSFEATWYCNDKNYPASAIVAYLEAHPALLDIYSVREYMKLADYSRKSIAELMGTEYESLIETELEETIKKFGVEKSQHSTEVLSSGQKKRLGLAMIQLQQAPYIILDEPRANLDQDGKELLVKLITEWKASNKIVFIATHDEEDIDLANRFFLVENNQVKKVTRNEVGKWINV